MNQIGLLIENGKRYVQTPESGAFEDTWADGVRTRVVSNIYHCLKSEVQTVTEDFEQHPTSLLSDGGRNPDGTLADYIDWGADYTAAGHDVQEISPGFARITAKYRADDPTGAAGEARTGVASGGIIGKPWGAGERYAEDTDSGAISEERIYDEDGDTWTRTRTIDFVLTCLRTDMRVVADAIDLTPASLVAGGVDWGAGYEAHTMSGQPISPSFARITVKYRIDMSDPVAPSQVTAYAGDRSIVGRPWEAGLIYAETPESGRLSEDRVYIETQYGWNRVRTIDKILVCLKCDTRTVVDGLEVNPSNLTTNPHEGATIEWGRQYHLTGISARPISPGMIQITAKYQAELAEAIVTPPDGIELECANGVCTITWNDRLFESMDSLLPDLDYGIDVDFSGYTINMYCNGVLFDSFTASGAPSTRILEWETDATTATLKWCGQKWREAGR